MVGVPSRPFKGVYELWRDYRRFRRAHVTERVWMYGVDMALPLRKSIGLYCPGSNWIMEMTKMILKLT